MVHSKFEINSALDDLVSGRGDIKNALRAVIQFASSLPLASFYGTTYRPNKDKGSSFSGFTQEQGNITIKDDGEKDAYKEHNYGTLPERVGHYKMHHEKNGFIRFRHFWKSDMVTRSISKEPDDFVIKYDVQNLSPLFYGVVGWRTILKIGLLHFCRLEINIIRDFRKVTKEREPYGFGLRMSSEQY